MCKFGDLIISLALISRCIWHSGMCSHRHKCGVFCTREHQFLIHMSCTMILCLSQFVPCTPFFVICIIIRLYVETPSGRNYVCPASFADLFRAVGFTDGTSANPPPPIF